MHVLTNPTLDSPFIDLQVRQTVISASFEEYVLFRWDLYSVIYGLVVLQRRRTDIRLPRLAVYDINHTLNPINSADSWNRTTDLWVRSPMLYLCEARGRCRPMTDRLGAHDARLYLHPAEVAAVPVPTDHGGSGRRR